MLDVLFLVIALILGYLLGSVNSSLLVGKAYGVDVREHGSGNAGMTNTLRTLGKLPAIIVTIGDVLKAVIACAVGYYLMEYFVGDFYGFSNVGLMAGGFGAILGHNWPVFFSFRGGKGVLTTFAFILMMDYRLGLILFLIFLILVVMFRYVSLGSISAAFAFPILAFAMRGYLGIDYMFILFASFVALLIVVRHLANIKRLLSGNENKLGKKAKNI